ncbi:helix-turn-helix domain-containing protein [Actinacidiphila glaucinigra]|uniref:helix-turn-helix domain-containing protein n=1 Tax=Actinacidiphila glaucinigra TaxID=235986 RepID=UPI0037217A83
MPSADRPHRPDNALGDFLRAQRGAVDVGRLGLPDDGRHRRVPGLRREELAERAHVSVDYVVRLEQGRTRRVSQAVLESLADALGLAPDERAYLFAIADVTQPKASRPAPAQRVLPQIQQLLDGMRDVPAMVLGRRQDVLAWNAPAAALLTDFAALPPEHRNVIRLTFLDPAYRALYGEEWAGIARECVASLRMEAGRYAEDPALAALVGELSVKDADFRSWWGSHRVRGARPRSKTYQHPLVGPLTLDVQQLTVEGQTGQSLITYTARPGTPSAEALRFLLQWSASGAPQRAAAGRRAAGEAERRDG